MGVDGLLHITSDLNVAKFHMIVSEDSSGNKTIKAADGETGLIMQYMSGTELGKSWYVFLVDAKLSEGWTE